MQFYKYQATGNDFIVCDNRDGRYDEVSADQWRELATRKVAIGADGILLLGTSERAEVDFTMLYLNSDGGEASMCGNGARAISHFAHRLLKRPTGKYRFTTKNGDYRSQVLGDGERGQVRVQMTELYDVEKYPLAELDFSAFKNKRYLNTGVPHVVLQVDAIDSFEVVAMGRKLRHMDFYAPDGANINFFSVLGPGKVRLRTYERGVEDETLACGTGAVATALACAKFFSWKKEVLIQTAGGEIRVYFDDDLEQIWLQGEVALVFSGDFF